MDLGIAGLLYLRIARVIENKVMTQRKVTEKTEDSVEREKELVAHRIRVKARKSRMAK